MRIVSDRWVTLLKIAGIVVAVVSVVGALVGIAVGMYQTRKIERSPNQAKFRSGSLPKPPPNGFLQGNHFSGLGKNWQGKVFEGANSSGINQFSDGQRYPFKTLGATGLRDRDRSVLRLDYNQSGNPWWLRFVTDEIVQTSPGHYLGKIHVKVLPGLPFSIGYFELTDPEL